MTSPTSNTPPNGINASIVHKITELYKNIYLNSKKLSKADKLGIRAKTERVCLDCLHLSIEAALTSSNQKLPLTQKLKIEIEAAKQLIRLEMELGTIAEDFYIHTQEKLQEVSKMASGWIRYLEKKEPL